MMKKSMIRWVQLIALGALLALPAAQAAASQASPLATIQSGGDLVQWQPLVSYDRLVLTISRPDGTVSRQEFDTRSLPSFEIPSGLDGSYTWELRAIPTLDDEARAKLSAARQSGDEEAVMSWLRANGQLPAEPMVQSGYFAVIGGAVVSGDQDEPVATGAGASQDGLGFSGVVSSEAPDQPEADQVILDDLIVDGSACIGNDCVNGESFGFDTVRLKENNLRIKFQDTSTTASFPSNDWQLTANDSSNGGANKFSIDDIDGGRTPFTIEASAPSHSLYVDDGGRVGLGTSTPVVELHVVDGDSPTLRLEQDGSSGFAPQTWDLAGNETNFFIRDVTNGSTLPFRIRPGAPTSSIDIANDGDVGIGTTSPQASLHVLDSDATLRVESNGTTSAREMLRLKNSGSAQVVLENTDSLVEWQFGPRDVNDDFAITRLGSGATEFLLTTDGNVSISGSLTVGAGGCTGCDLVFQPEYDLESIEEHARYMWKNSHLPGVGPTPEDAPMNLSQKTGGILNELEKAHIYIEQVHNRLQDKEAKLAELQEVNSELSQRIERLEALIEKNLQTEE